MNRVRLRSTLILLLPALLLLAMVIFCAEYLLEGGKWVDHWASPYSSYGLGNGIITDRNGQLLMDTTGDGRAYSDDRTTRESTLHLIGDRDSFIDAPAVPEYSSKLAGYSLLSGLYHLREATGSATLTVDANVQNTALEALDGRKGTVAVYNYKTGEILCAVTSPTFDPDDVPDFENDTEGVYEGIFLNRFTQASYVPGSIFKAATTAAALSELPDAETLTFTCEGTWELDGEIVKCEGCHGEVTLKQAFMHSCNCFFAQLAHRMGPEVLQKYVDAFRLTVPVEFDGIVTREGNFEVMDAAPVDVCWSAIGQHKDLINPCRYMLFMGQIAGGGLAAKPYLVEHVSSGFMSSYQARQSLTERVLSTEVALKMQEYMHYNVEANYGEYQFPDIGVCAKTGTAETGRDTSTATFTGFCTDERYPLAFIAIVEDGGYGRAVCIPIVSQVLYACVDSLDRE